MTRWHILHLEDQVEPLAEVPRAWPDDDAPPRWQPVTTCEAFEAALAQAPFDAVICGDGVPGLTGLQALARLRQQRPQVPVLFFSAAAEPAQARACLEAGAHDHVPTREPWRLGPALGHLRTALTQQTLARERQAHTLLVQAAQRLSLARRLDEVMAVVRQCARAMVGSDGATFVLRDADYCWYADEDAIEPLWKGQRFPMSNCVSGWAMQHRQSLVIPDIRVDARIPQDVYLRTFVRSLVMVPIRMSDPIGAIGSYWSQPHAANEAEVALLQALADTACVALDHVRLQTELEQRVQDRTAQLAEANEELEAFSYSVSHDLRAPLRAIDGYATLLDEDKGDQLDAEMRQFLAAIRSSAKHMGDLIDDLLELSRVSRSPVGRQPVDISLLAQHILAALQAQTPERDVTTVIAPGIVLQGDPGLLHRALENLLDNAWKYTAKTPAARIELMPWHDEARSENGVNGFCLADNGAGFDMARAGRLFEPFSRMHAASEFSGTGIGLTIVRRVVQRHQGRVWAQSQQGQGARFYVGLPRP